MTTDEYVYQEPTGPNFGPLPEGEYDFTVIDVPSEPYRSKKGNFVLPVKLGVGPNQVHVYDNPSAGLTGTGNTYDNIASFLKSIHRNPEPGQRANLSRQRLVGARGRAMLKVEIAKQGGLIGKPVNRVHYYIYTAPTGELVHQPKQEDVEPGEIPF